MAYLKNRGTTRDPNWYIRFRDTDRKWKERSTHQATKEAAKRYAAEVESRVARGNIGIPEATKEELARKAITVDELIKKFLVEYTSPRINDIDFYRAQARSLFKVWISPALGTRPAVSVKTADAERLRDDELAQGKAPGSVAQTLAALSRLYTWAQSAGLVDCHNPVNGCTRTQSAESLDFLDRPEVGRLLAVAEDQARVGVASWAALGLFPMIATAIYSGLRKGELFGLRWIDVALDAARLSVNRSYTGKPKSGKSRHVGINPELLPILRRWRDLCPATDEGLVFPVEAEPVRSRMGSKEDMLGLPELLALAACHAPADGKPWHMLRHTFAAQFMMSGGNIFTLQKLLGHASLKMTQRYAHLAPDFMSTEVARMSFAPPAPAGTVDLTEARRKRAAQQAEPGADR